MRGGHGAVRSQPGSPLPQHDPGPVDVHNVRLLDAFFQFFPSKTTTFFQRVYFAQYPRPVQQGGLPGFPRPVAVARIKVPANQGIILTQFFYRVYEHSGIDVDDVVEVDPSRTSTVFGFQTMVGNRGLTDYNTNLTARGDVIAWNPAVEGGVGFAPQPGQGSFFPFAGSSQQGLPNFAAYARPGQAIEATAIILRPPPYDTRLFSVEFTGIIMSENMMDRMLDRLSGLRNPG